ncbi:hypothetical protein BJ912DRAFT_1024889 [Pholiota molesta]|nr:hypothetical protein BJ912DRAFT_1024889 [Pholiota molesta]
MSSPKERHYWAQLRAALTAGRWRASHPAKAPNGTTALPWPELLRKFNKHCPGYRDISELAALTQALALLLSARYEDDDEDIEVSMPAVEQQGSDAEVASQRGELDIDGECVLSEERIEEAIVGYELLKSLGPTSFDSINLALAYYAYAFKRPEECLSHLQKVPNLLQYQSLIPTSPDSARTSQSLSIPSTYAPSTSSFAASFASTSSTDGIIPEVRDGRAWAITETFRSLCLQGMSFEQLYPSDSSKAINAYRQALPLLATLQLELGFTSNSSAPNTGKSPYRSSALQDTGLFNQMRELWRWVERLLWRAVILSAKTCDVFIDGVDAPLPDNIPSPPLESRTSSTSTVTPTTTTPRTISNSLWTWLTHYSACSALWPPTFRAKHRSTVSVIHLRAFILRFGGIPPPSPSPTPVPSKTSSGRSSASSGSGQKHQRSWRTEALEVVKAYRTILTASTRFPRAGKRNVKVEEFVELCIALWEAGWVVNYKRKQSSNGWENIGEDLGTIWVIDTLQWSQTLTFNSSLILRHLTKILYLSATSALSPAPQNRLLAKRTLNLYIQVVGKAWEASKEGVGEDMDTDARWVETLVFGARMLASETARHFREGGIEDVQEAARVLEKARLRLDESDVRLVADVLLAEGVVWGLLGVISQDPLNRSANLQTAHTALLRSIQTNPTPSAYYHLALSFARRIPSSSDVPPTVIHSSKSTPEETRPVDPYKHTHSLTRALECAGLAVEGRPADVRYWHLLGLLLSAQENWAGAREVLERGAALDFFDADEEVNAGESQHASSGTEDNESEDSEEEEENAGTGDGFVVLGANGTDRQRQVPNGSASVPKRKRRSTIVPNGNGGAGTVTSAPTGITVLHPSETSLPPASTILTYLHPTPTQRTEAVLFERHLQLRMTQVALMEVMNGAEGAEEGWLEVFAWTAERRPVGERKDFAPTPVGVEPPQPEEKIAKMRMYQGLSVSAANMTSNVTPNTISASWNGTTTHQSLEVPIGIMISPATPEIDAHEEVQFVEEPVVVSGVYDEKDEGSLRGRRADGQDLQSNQAIDMQKTPSLREKEILVSKAIYSPANGTLYPKIKRSMSSERGTGDTSKSKKVQQMLKNRVHKSRAGITAVSRKIGHGVVKNGGLRRSTSTPDFHAALQPTSYQASSIHSRRRLSSIIHSSDEHERGLTDTRTTTPIQGEWPTTPSPMPSSATSSHRDFSSQTSTAVSNGTPGSRNMREDRLMSDLWLMSAATFRRLGKIEHAKGAIQEAELRDETNPNVWVQLALYYAALRLYQQAVDTLQKARFISPDDVAATVHLARLYLDPDTSSPPIPIPNSTSDTDLATGMLARLAKARGWDVPEVWYFLSKAYALQGRKEMEREALKTALELSEGRGVRDIGRALGWCL